MKELKLFRFFHRHGHHLRCTVGQQTRTCPSCLTATACSARSRRPTGRRATPSSSVTPSPLAPQTPSGLSWSSFFYQCMETNTPRKIVTQSILSGYLEKLVKVIWYWPKCWLSDFIVSMLLKFFCKLCGQFVTICVASRPKCFFSHVTLISNQFILA